MRKIAVSVLSLFVMLPAFGNARLPVVNIAAGGVSARSMFGEPAPTPAATTSTIPVVKNKKVVARSSKKVTAPVVTPAKSSVDTGEKIAARADVLVPNRPSADLWARSDAPLRMPSASEFAVIRSDAILPEENLDAAPRKNVAPRATTNVATRDVAPMSEIDAQIAYLNELQRRADESVKSEPVRDVVARADTMSATTADVNIVSKNVAPVARVASATSVADDASVKLSRMVVPMENDVIIRAVEKSESPRIAAVRDDMTKMTPTELRKAFRKTFLSENKHLSTYQIDDRFDVVSDMSVSTGNFTSSRDLSESGGIRPLEIKIKFRNDDAALSRDNYNLLSEYAGIVLANPTRAIQVAIPQNVTTDSDARKLAARRLAIVEQVLRDSGVSEQRVLPVLSNRNDDGFVLRMISNDQYETLTQKRRDMFGDTLGKKTYKSMAW